VTSSVSRKRSPTELIAPAAHRATDAVEVETGFEPVYTALQAVASPLGHSTTKIHREVGGLRADDGIRTRDPHLGKVMLYQLSHVRAQGRREPSRCVVNLSRPVAAPSNQCEGTGVSGRGVAFTACRLRWSRRSGCRVPPGSAASWLTV
jgi:hypothetical protein